MKMHIEPEQLMTYLDGELAVDQASAASVHLDHCRECQGLAADFQKISRRLTEWQIESTDIDIVWEPPAVKKPRRFRLSRSVWVIAPAAALVAIVWLVSP